MSKPDFPTDLKAALVRASMTQRDLARATNIEEATISRYCNGLKVGPRNSARILEVLSPAQDGPVST
jgi:transcriptional regulator with XRE-family HTH domain